MGTRVLIVEDEIVVALFMEDILAEFGYQVAGVVSRLDEEDRGKHALRGLVEQHHRVPVVHVRSLEEAQLMLAEIDHLPLGMALDAA